MGDMFLSMALELVFVVGLIFGLLVGGDKGTKTGLEIAFESVDMSVVKVDDEYKCLNLEDLR